MLFSGRTVIAAGSDLRIDQIALAEDIAWTIYGPFVDRKLGNSAAATRGKEAAAALDTIMADSWLLLNRAPSIMPTSILAFHAVRIPEKVIRLHPLTNMLLNADYDGDQSAVFLPITEAGQREASERLSVAGHLRRDPSLLHWVIPSHTSLWALARLSLSHAGREQISEILGVPVAAPQGFLTRSSLEEAARTLLQREGPDRDAGGTRSARAAGLRAVAAKRCLDESVPGCSPAATQSRPKATIRMRGTPTAASSPPRSPRPRTSRSPTSGRRSWRSAAAPGAACGTW